MSRRAVIVTLDACGVGALPDAADYGDAGADTLAHLAGAVGGLALPHLESLGLGNVSRIAGVPPASAPRGVFGRLHPLGPGKDSTTGHWELMGAVPSAAMPTYPNGFPDEVLAALRASTGHEFCLNAPANGIAAIEQWGAHHLRTGELILYTSQDSVLQIAAHAQRLPVPALHDVCARARVTMTGEHAVGRVIARPFGGEEGAFARVPGRRDLALAPAPNVLDAIADAGIAVHGVGKVRDLFAGRGIAEHHAAGGNAEAIAATDALLASLDAGLIFTNLVDTDQLYSHRKDAEGFAAALTEIDAAVGRWLAALREGDLLILTADHGCDVAMRHSDHTREHVPLLAAGRGVAAGRHDGPMADVGATAHRWLTGRAVVGLPGTAFAGEAARA